MHGKDTIMPFSLLSISLILIFAIITAVEIYRYINRGLNGSLLALGSSIVSLILSLVFSPIISGALVSLILSMAASMVPSYSDLITQLPSGETAIKAILTAVLNSLLFLIVFFVFRRIVRMVIYVICKITDKKDNKDPGYAREKESWYVKYGKVFSGIIGALSGFILFILITSPIFGTIGTVVKVADLVETAVPGTLQKYAINGEIISDMKDDLENVADDAVGNVFYKLGGEQLYEASACADIDYRRVYISDEIDAAEDVLKDLSYLTKSLEDDAMLNADDADVLYSIGEHFQEVEIIHYLAADILSVCADAWLTGYTFCEMEKPMLNPLVDGAVDEVLAVCANTNEYNVKMNLKTLTRVCAIILESDIMNVDVSNYSEIIAFVDESGLIDRINTELAANPYMNGISVSSIAMSAIADSISVEALGIENYNELMNNISNAIQTVNSRGYGSEEEKVEVLTSYAQKYISEYDLEVPDSVAEMIAQELLTVVSSSETGEITAQDVANFIDQYN